MCVCVYGWALMFLDASLSRCHFGQNLAINSETALTSHWYQFIIDLKLVGSSCLEN